MRRLRLLLPLLLLGLGCLLPATGRAVSFEALAYSPNHHAVWIPDLGLRNLAFEPGARFENDGSEWRLDGSLFARGAPDVRFVISLRFFDPLPGYCGPIKGNSFGPGCIPGAPDWEFMGSLEGSMIALGGAENPFQGRSWEITRRGIYPGQLGTGLNDKTDDYGMSAWIWLRETTQGPFAQSLETDTSRIVGDINLRLESPIPEPSSAVLFVLGSLIVGGVLHRQRG